MSATQAVLTFPEALVQGQRRSSIAIGGILIEAACSP
jgi:hypothetical protein